MRMKLNNDNDTINMSDDGTRYIINGNRYVRVSEILSTQSKMGLEIWKKRLGEEKASEIADVLAEIGEKIHKITAYHDTEMEEEVKNMLEVDPWLLPFLLMWEEWVDRFVKKWVAVEYVVWSDKYGVAGRTDRIGMLKGDSQLSSVDIKSGGFWPEHALQLSIYKIMHNETQKTKIQRVVGVGWNYPKREGKLVTVEEYVREKMNPMSLKFKEWTDNEVEKEARRIMKEWVKMFGV